MDSKLLAIHFFLFSHRKTISGFFGCRYFFVFFFKLPVTFLIMSIIERGKSSFN